MSVHQCPECRREFEVLYPDLWAYKSGKGNNARFICSWCCLRRYEKRGVKEMQLSERDQKALDIALEGGNPIEFLKGFGIKNPGTAWYNIKLKVKHGDLETYRKLPAKITSKKPTAGDAIAAAQEAADTFFGQCGDMGLKVETPETPEKPKITKPVNYDGLEVSAVRDPNLGEFYYDHDHNCIDWRNGLGDEVSLPISGWKIMVERLAKILQVLGVDA